MAKKKTSRSSSAAGNNARGAASRRDYGAVYLLSLTVENVRCFGEEPQTLDLSDGNGRPARWMVLLGDNGSGKTTLSRHFWTGGHAQMATGTSGSIQPMLACAYGAWRSLAWSSSTETENQWGVENIFCDTEPLRNAQEWLLQLDHAASKKSAIQVRKKDELQRVKTLLVDLLPDVEDIRICVPSAERPAPYVEFETPFGWVPLRQLGYGYQTLIAWMVDLASRMVEAYPASANPLAEPAVVLVDEIDLHLHPRWQREIMGYLTKRFPNTQFIATAHSPLIVQAAADANIAVLRREGDRVVIDNDVKTVHGWRIDQVLTSDLFGLPTARPPQLDHALQRRKELLTKGRLTKKDKDELANLEARIGRLPAGETAAQSVRETELLEQTYQLLKKHTGQ